MIHLDGLRYTYPGVTRPALRDVALEVVEGELALVTGYSGSGKSTLLRCLNGLVPHFTGGSIGGVVTVAGHDPIAEGPQVLSRVAGFVFQDPEAQFVVDRVEDEIAFALENQGMPRAEMRRVVAESLELLDLTSLRDRPIDTLSGGQKQRVAIAAALAARPRLLILDEPTSQLDPESAEEVIQALVSINREQGLTVVLSEHRLERVLHHVDRLIHFAEKDGVVIGGPAAVAIRAVEHGPPIVELGRALGWDPLPLTVEDASRLATTVPVRSAAGERRTDAPRSRGDRSIAVDGLSFTYPRGIQPALQDVTLDVHEGETVALIGRNGSGKTTLFKCIVGLLRPERGVVLIGGRPTRGRDVAELCREVAYLPQVSDDLLFADTVEDELLVTLRNHGQKDGARDRVLSLLGRLGLTDSLKLYPRDLSVGQRQRVALGAVTITQPRCLLLDEPTRGLDYRAKAGLAHLLRGWRNDGMAILIATHDVELIARVADRVVHLDHGSTIAEGTPGDILTTIPALTPQIARLFPRTGWLTVEDVLAAVERGGASVSSRHAREACN